ncbi:type VI secretion system contractile sheath small subunit [Neisseriaceae bacterium PsAf]|nr:type VI secretion system contractile sheath small subunit [Neisseriaceae bacterium PsAf]MCV2503436.1 type VI secretion system contractile sheath small subunit [Neisseriaceae bacterium]
MSSSQNSQKFLGKNNAPRVQIEYDVEIYGSPKKVNLPFVTGVISDLSGKSLKDLPPIHERKFLNFDQDNFDARMRSIQPRVKFYVDNTLVDDDQEMLDIDLVFESMKDFSPGSMAERIPALAELLEARKSLKELISYMDGKVAAEKVVRKMIEDPDFLVKLADDPQSVISNIEEELRASE